MKKQKVSMVSTNILWPLTCMTVAFQKAGINHLARFRNVICYERVPVSDFIWFE